MTKEIKKFFDRHAHKWDSFEKPDIGLTINKILDRISILRNDKILDVGCGTGILVPFFEKRGIKNFIGVDFSAKMISEYRKKFPGRKAVIGDFEKPGLFKPDSFTKVIIYNAFPHFQNRMKVFINSWTYLKPGGGIYIVHSMSRKELDRHHQKSAGEVADHMLPSNHEFKRLYVKAGFENIEIDDSDLFFSKGIKPF